MEPCICSTLARVSLMDSATGKDFAIAVKSTKTWARGWITTIAFRGKDVMRVIVE